MKQFKLSQDIFNIIAPVYGMNQDYYDKLTLHRFYTAKHIVILHIATRSSILQHIY